MADISLFGTFGDKGVTAETHQLYGDEDTHVLTIACDGAEVKFYLTEEQIGYLFGTLNAHLDRLDKKAHA